MSSRIKQLPADKLFDVMKNLAAAINAAAFRYENIFIDKLGQEVMQEQPYADAARDFGARQGRGLKRISVLTGTGIDAIAEALGYSHWALFEDIEITRLTDSSLRFRTRNCSVQKSAVGRGMEYWPCKGFALNSRSGFVQAIEPNAEIRCVFQPPDPRPQGTPEEVSCEWLVSIKTHNP